jgi:succinate dehydrogenase / fumarate reductase iron-sulfur subunit
MLDAVNERLILKGEEPIAFDHDCREGICGTCGVVINGRPHGPRPATTTCQLHMRSFRDGDTIVIEPCGRRRSRPARPRGARRLRPHHRGRRLRLGRHRQCSGRQCDPDPQARRRARHGRRRLHWLRRLRAACCCVGLAFRRRDPTSPPAAGQPDAAARLGWSRAWTRKGSLHEPAVRAACPKGISVGTIARLNRDFLRAALTRSRRPAQGGGGQVKTCEMTRSD